MLNNDHRLLIGNWMPILRIYQINRKKNSERTDACAHHVIGKKYTHIWWWRMLMWQVPVIVHTMRMRAGTLAGAQRFRL